MIKLGITVISLIILLATVHAQTVKGRVIDAQTGLPLPGANIIVKNTYYGCSTDTTGRFILDVSRLEKGDYFLQATYIGYYDREYRCTIPFVKKNELVISLEPSLLQMDQIVVTGTRTERFLKDTPVATRVISAEQLWESGSNDIAQALSEVTGVMINENQFGTGVKTVEVQGLSSEHIQVLVNGMKMIGRVNGQLDISQIPLAQVERIEIVKGAASALYGSEAMGGVINIITKRPQDDPGVDVNLYSGSYGRVDGALSVNTPVGVWQPVLNLSYRRYDGYDMDIATVSQDATAFQKFQGQLSVKGQLEDSLSVNIESIYFSEKHEVVSSSIFTDKIVNDHKALRLQMQDMGLLGGVNLKTGVEYSVYDHGFDRIVRSSGFLKKGSLTTERLAKADALFDFDLGSHQINGGYALEMEKIYSDRIIGKVRKTTLNNLFVQDEWKLSGRFTLLGGLRMDMHSIYGSQFSPKLSCMISPSSRSRVRLAYAEGFRAPSFKELYLDYTNISVRYHIQGNPDLKPEISSSYQTDVEFWNDNNYHLRLHLFFNRIRNLIDYTYLGVIDGFGAYRSANLLAAKTWGADWDMEYFPTDWLNLRLGYSYLGTQDETTGQPIAFKPVHKAQAALRFELKHGIKIALRGQYFGNRFYWQEPEETTQSGVKGWIKDYFLLHANLSLPVFGRFKVELGGKNLTDYMDKKWGPMPGREWYLGLHINGTTAK